jgi:hypothetical protein
MRVLSSLIILLAISWNLSAQSPHGKDFSTNCGDCHTTEGWKMGGGSSFNHDTTDFALIGQHKLLDCKSCHKTLIFSQTKKECMYCHTDIHSQTVGFECERCHTPKSWIVENITEIHQMGRFPLVGPHVTADCYDCHPSASLLLFEPLGVECYDCHKEEYQATTNPNHIAGNFSTDCSECHFMTSFTWTGGNFNHSFFPLTEGHAISDCYQCHIEGQEYSSISPECVTCHETDYNNTTNPNHVGADFSTDCAGCHTTHPGWTPAEFPDHDALFPIYSGSHEGEWSSCSECHTTPGNYSLFSCIDCHEHNKQDTDEEHNEVGGYVYDNMACYECHPTGDAEGGFDHNASNFPLTGAHLTTECKKCHASGFSGTPTICFACHEPDYIQSTNPAHTQIGIATDCEVCHTTNPDWKPALYPNHNDAYPLLGAHQAVATNCFLCHEGNYVNTPNLCYNCHSDDYNQTTDPPHAASQFSTSCETCHSVDAWQPATFDHDGQYFPIYSGKHDGEWNSCSECHENPSNYAQFTCLTCHEEGETGDEHNEVGGYAYNSPACLECHPDGSAEGSFNHNNSNFPLTGAHLTTECNLCHANGYVGTPTVCFACHEPDFNQSINPNHNALSIPNDCETCHTTNPGWAPASFAIHNNYYPITGAHIAVQTNCFICHEGDYINTPNTCFGCHDEDYNQTTDPDHAIAQFPTDCEACHNDNAWVPSTFDHDGQFFPIYSGKHDGEWNSCSECHENPADYSIFTCLTCHEEAETGDEHNEVGGYSYNSPACLECHPDGSAEGAFNHDGTEFPLTGAHITTDCSLCHVSGYSGTPTYCFACHEANYNQSANPNHTAISIPNECETCHTTNPGWQPASFPIHDNYYPLIGEHIPIASNCFICHEGDYNNTPDACEGCHIDNYNGSANPDHDAIGIPTDCGTCHTPSPEWEPAAFPIHDDYYPLLGEHIPIASDCFICHQGDYNNTPNACEGCHMEDYSGSANPDHDAIGIPTDCGTCHTPSPDWEPAAFPIHDEYWPLTGAHLTIQDECDACHQGDYNDTPDYCYGCHEADYNQTTDPDHAAAQFPTDCEICHTTVAWIPSTFEHDGQYFPIYSGSHEGEWNTCSECHPNPSDYGIFTCLTCHEQAETDEEHNEVSGYVYESNACLNCHPDGEADGMLRKFKTD